MIHAKLGSGGARLEVVDTPSWVATVFAWLFRVTIALGVAMALVGVAMTLLDLAQGGSPWKGLQIAGNAVLLAGIGWGGSRGWSRLVTARRSVIDRARGTIETHEKAAGKNACSRLESCADVRAVRITTAETTGPQRTSMRVLRLWLVLARERTVLLGDVADVAYAVASLERAARATADFIGVPIERATVHDVPPEAEHVVEAPGRRGAFERSWPLMSWRQRLLYVPGIAILLGVPMAVGLGPTHPFVPIGTAMMLLLPLLPVLAIGGRITARVGPDALEIVRVPFGRRVVVPLRGGPVRLHVHRMHGRHRALARLSCATPDGDTVLVQQAPAEALQRIADDLARALG